MVDNRVLAVGALGALAVAAKGGGIFDSGNDSSSPASSASDSPGSSTQTVENPTDPTPDNSSESSTQTKVVDNGRRVVAVENPADPTPDDPNEPSIDLRDASPEEIARTVERTPDLSDAPDIGNILEGLSDFARESIRKSDTMLEARARLSGFGVYETRSDVPDAVAMQVIPVPSRPSKIR